MFYFSVVGMRVHFFLFVICYDCYDDALSHGYFCNAKKSIKKKEAAYLQADKSGQ